MTKSTILAGCALALALVSCSTQSAENPHTDFAAMDAFWRVHQTLSDDEEPSADDWSALFAADAYQRMFAARPYATRERLQELLREAYKPSMGVSRDAKISGNAPEGFVLGHLVRTGEQKATLAAFEKTLRNDPAFIKSAVTLASAYLPKGAVAEEPLLRFAAFAPDGYPANGDIVADILYLSDMGDKAPAFVAHEMHHLFAKKLSVLPTPESDSELYWFVLALQYLQDEGVADLIDKKAYPIEASVDYLDFYAQAYNQAYAGSKQLLGAFDKAVVALSECEANCAELAGKTFESLPIGAHPQGFYMATAVEKELGKNAIVESLGNPFEFVRAYQRAATKKPDAYYVFSSEAMAYFDKVEGELVRK